MLTCWGQMLNYVDKSTEVWTEVLNGVDKSADLLGTDAELCG